MEPKLPEEATDKSDINTLCKVAKRFNDFLSPKLWRNLAIWTRDEQTLEELVFPTARDDHNNIEGAINHTKGIEVLSHFHEELSDRCVHFKDIEHPTGDVSYMDQLEDSIRRILDNIENGTLEKFTWGIGTCIPLNVMKDLNTFQNSIKELSLCTGSGCLKNHSDESAIDFSELSSLKTLSWSNIYSSSDLESIRTLLKNNRGQLREVKLDFEPYRYDDDIEDEYEDESHFASYVIGLPQELESQKILFPRLKVLSLAGADLVNVGTQLLHALNFRNLTSLSLRDCRGFEVFFMAMTEMHDPETPTKLTSFEAVCERLSHWDKEPFPRFEFSEILSNFKFTNLFINMGRPTELEILSVLSHLNDQKESLERFVFHGRCCLASGFDEFGLLTRPLAMYTMEHEMNELFEKHPEYRGPFETLLLKCLGLSCAPDSMRAISGPSTCRKTLQILHMRKCNISRPDYPECPETFERPLDPKSYKTIANKVITPLADDLLWPFHATKNGEIAHLPGDLFDFLEWLFGPDGVTSLRVFAFGDFSHNGRYRAYNHIFCRREEPIEELRERDEPDLNLRFRPIRETDYVLWDLIEKNKDFLDACSTDLFLAD